MGILTNTRIMEHLLEENVAAEDLKKFEARYQAELSAGLVSASAQFDYAWCLVRSKYPSDIRKLGRSTDKSSRKFSLVSCFKFLQIFCSDIFFKQMLHNSGILSNVLLDGALWMLVFRAFSLRFEQINIRLSI